MEYESNDDQFEEQKHDTMEEEGSDTNSNTSLLAKLYETLSDVQVHTSEILEESESAQTKTLQDARMYLSDLIRKDHDNLQIGSNICQEDIDKLSKLINTILIAASWLGVLVSMYNTIAAVFIVNGDNGNSTLVERIVVTIPPAVVTGIVTAIIIFLQQLQFVDKLKDLTNVKIDADYVCSKMEPMYILASRATSLQELTSVDEAYRGETSALKQKVTRALSRVLTRENRVKGTKKYRFYMLVEQVTNVAYEDLYKMLERHQETGVPIQEALAQIGRYGKTPLPMLHSMEQKSEK